MLSSNVIEKSPIRDSTVVGPAQDSQQSPLTRLANGEHSLYFYRGRVALCAILRALDLRPGDEVLLQAFTCLAVPLPIVGLGLRPVYVDIDMSTFNMNPRELEARVTPRTKAIVVQHTFGIPADMDPILALAKRRGLWVIEDCCHVLGSKYRGRDVGSFGDAAFYSYEWGKPVVLGLGGAALINSPDLLKRLDAIYSQFCPAPQRSIWLLNLEYLGYFVLRRPALFWAVRDLYRALWTRGVIIGNFQPEEFAGRLTSDYYKLMPRSFQCRLSAKLRNGDAAVVHRKKVGMSYESGLRELGFGQLPLEANPESVLLRYPVRACDKEKVLREARRRRIEVGGWFVSPVDPLHEHEWKNAGYRKGSCPVAEQASREVVTLPIYEAIGDKQIQRALEFVRDMRDASLLRGC